MSLGVHREEMTRTFLAQPLFLLLLVTLKSGPKSTLSLFLLKIDEEKFGN